VRNNIYYERALFFAECVKAILYFYFLKNNQPSPFQMFTAIHPKLPMRDKTATKDFYINQLGFHMFGNADYEGYLMVEKDNIQIHFFEFKELNPLENYGQVYIRTSNIEALYEQMKQTKAGIHPNGHLQTKPWGQKEFSMLDPDHNLLTFGEEA
jgi:catechol 2,3-dioxygenase-like lactoylglutathione lyase family enzyme